MKTRSLFVIGATLALLGAGCRQEDGTCRTLAELCPMPGNYESCRKTLEPLDAAEARKRHSCVVDAKSCSKAASCVAGTKNSWDIYKPISADSAQ
jgi:hypothetical protein